MPRGQYVRKPKEDEPVSNENVAEQQIKVLSDKFDSMVSIIETLANSIADIRQKEDGIQHQQIIPPVEDNEIEDLTQMFPRVWRKIVDNILGKDFGTRIVDTANGDFIMFVEVPEYLDRRLAKDDDTNKTDISTGLVRRASAPQDVQIWCEKIKKTIQKVYPLHRFPLVESN